MYRQNQGGGPPRPGQQQLVLPSAGDVGTLVVRGVTTFAKKHKVISGSYILGILVILLIGSGTKLNYDQRRQYNAIMDTIDEHAIYDATVDYMMANEAYHATKGWFFSCDHICTRNKHKMEKAKLRLDQLREQSAAVASDAKAVAGIFSEIGVGEVKDSFWSYFSTGKDFAKRQTMWDAMFMGIRSMSRDENMLEYALKVLMQLLVNFSLGLVVALVMFVIGLWSIVRSYQANPLVALVFFVCAACAAFSFVVTYLFAMYGAAAGGVYGVLKVAETNARAARIEQQRRQQYMGNRPHYD